MIWLNNYTPNNNIQISFYQIFIESTIVYNDEKGNTIYSFESTNNTNKSNQKFILNLDNCENIECDIKIIDTIISYSILSDKKINKNFVFTMKTNFIKPSENQYNIPIFFHIYKSASTKTLPNLIESEYTFASTIKFKIYNLDTEQNSAKIQFVIETNPLTNIIRKYFLTTNLNCIQKYFINE